MPTPSPEADQDEFLKEAAQSLATNQARAEERSRRALRTILAAASREPRIRIEYRRGWAPVILAFLLGITMFPLVEHVALPAWQKHREHAEQKSIIPELKRAQEIMERYEQSAAKLGLRR